MFFIYLGVALLERRTGWRWLLPALLCVGTVAPFLFNYLTDGMRLPAWVVGIQTWHTLNYFPYFLLGIFARRYDVHLWRVVDNRYFKASVIAGFLALVIFYGCRHRYSLEWDLVMTLMRFTGLMTLLVTFRSYRDWFDSGNTVSNVMCTVGSRTLDIYYLHYFFIPDLGFMKGFLSAGHGNSILAMLTIGLTISALVVALCMLVSAVLRSSPLLASWLFGASDRSAAHDVTTR